MDRRYLWAAGGALVLGAGAYLLLGRGDDVSGLTLYGPGFPVRHRERADGVDLRLQAFLTEWQRTGPFGLLVAVDGGVRTDEALQAQLFATGRSKAPTLAKTPHGRRGAIDCYPCDGARIWGLDGEPDPAGAMARFQVYAARGRAAGLVSGGDFKSIKDWPHLEVPDWQSLPIVPGLLSS